MFDASDFLLDEQEELEVSILQVSCEDIEIDPVLAGQSIWVSSDDLLPGGGLGQRRLDPLRDQALDLYVAVGRFQRVQVVLVADR